MQAFNGTGIKLGPSGAGIQPAASAEGEPKLPSSNDWPGGNNGPQALALRVAVQARRRLPPPCNAS